MKLFSKKTTFLIGSILGSVAGLLFARESGNTLRNKLKAAQSPQKKFEALFQEYLKVGKAAIEEIKEQDGVKDILQGGREILEELKKKAKTESSRAVKIAQQKTAEIIEEVEKQTKTAQKVVKKKAAKIKAKINSSKILATKKKTSPKKKTTVSAKISKSRKK